MKMTAEQFKRLQHESNRKLNKLVGSRTENKYKAKSQYYKGQFYHSTGEKEYAEQLDLRLKAGDITKWERQVKIELRVKGELIANYYCDFKVTHNDGHIELIEYKGVQTDLFLLKWRLLHILKDELFPGGVTITMVKHRNKYNPFKKRK